MSNKLNAPANTANGVTDAATEKTRDATDWVADQAEGVKNTAIDLAGKVQDRAETMAKSFAKTAMRAKDQAGELIGDVAEPVKQFAEHKYEQSMTVLKELGDDATAMIRKYPIAAIAIGLGLGLLVGRAASGGRA